MRSIVFGATVAVGGWALTVAVPAQVVPDYDFQWATIGDVGNHGYDRPGHVNDGYPVGRGSVGYTYRISRLEITTAQWMEYINTFTTQSDAMSFFLNEPSRWGGESDLGYSGPGRRYRLDNDAPYGQAAAALAPVFGLTWREAAQYCNWLHNNKSADPAALRTGAYDASTWGRIPGTGIYTDQERHLPGARFWIPTFDEHLKAAHYDPDKFGPGMGGWWQANTRSDVAAFGGPPGIGVSSVGTHDSWIPLGAYPETTSAYGLLDLSGGAPEWLEDYYPIQLPSHTNRMWDGSWVDYDRDPDRPLESVDLATLFGASRPVDYSGLRIASIPAPGWQVTWFGFVYLIGNRKRRANP